MRLIVARYEVRYSGRLAAVLPEALRLVMIKSDGSVMVHADTQDALGERWPAVVRERRADRDAAAAEQGRARATGSTDAAPVAVETLRAAWERMTTRDRRELLALRVDCIALRRDPVEMVVYPAGTGPAHLPRRGFKSAPVLTPFPDAPAAAPARALKPAQPRRAGTRTAA